MLAARLQQLKLLKWHALGLVASLTLVVTLCFPVTPSNAQARQNSWVESCMKRHPEPGGGVRCSYAGSVFFPTPIPKGV